MDTAAADTDTAAADTEGDFMIIAIVGKKNERIKLLINHPKVEVE